ncbi:MAG: hypothetical protein AVO35_08650 [Candidatus Aegiribacteria sp. MLS_C]|nr:MAG: hypothetical protein AVO35_08650 [Candidatus Aegiribacteria sp. MLS_C]
MNISVTSPSNSRLKVSRQLDSRSGIVRNGLFLMEGPRFISDLLVSREPEWVILSTDARGASRETAARVSGMGCDVLEVPPGLFADISDTDTSQGILAVFPLPEPDSVSIPGTGLILLLDGVSDPGNTGTLIRSAAAFGCSGVVTGRGCCFPYIPKVTRAAAGLNARIPILFDAVLPSFMRRLRPRTEFIGADPAGDEAAVLNRRRESLGLVIGSEARGISTEVAELLDRRVAIPMAPGVESLNAAVSGSILLYEACRSRRTD